MLLIYGIMELRMWSNDYSSLEGRGRIGLTGELQNLPIEQFVSPALVALNMVPFQWEPYLPVTLEHEMVPFRMTSASGFRFVTFSGRLPGGLEFKLNLHN